MDPFRLRGEQVQVGFAKVYPRCHPEATPTGQILDESVILHAIILAKRQPDLEYEPFAYIEEPDSSMGIWLDQSSYELPVRQES